jgi:hypothetical protein
MHHAAQPCVPSLCLLGPRSLGRNEWSRLTYSIGGLAALIKLLGPSCVRDSLAKDVTLGAVGSIVSYMYFIKKCKPINCPVRLDHGPHNEKPALLLERALMVMYPLRRSQP